MNLHRPILALAALAALSACGVTPALPQPTAGGSLTGTFVGSSKVTGKVFPGIAVVSYQVALKANLVEADGALTGTAEATLDNGEPSTSPLQGTNDNGRVSFNFQIPVCGQTITLALKGTVNPENRINFEGVSKGISCSGIGGEAVLDPFSITRAQ